MTSTVDLFADVTTASGSDTSTESTESTENTTEPAEDKPEILTEAPAGAMTVAEFAEMLSKTVEVSAEKEVTFVFGIVMPQTVYQTVQSKGNPIPHVFVQTPDMTKPRVMILKDAGIDYWKEYTERNRNRGTGAGSVSRRTPEVLKEDFSAKLAEYHQLADRVAALQQRLDGIDATLTKYEGWLDGAGVTTDEVATLKADALATHNTDKARKAADREAKRAAAKAEAENA